METAHGAEASLAWWGRACRREKEAKVGRQGGESGVARGGEGRRREGDTGGDKYSDWASQGEGARRHDELGLEKKRDGPRNKQYSPASTASFQRFPRPHLDDVNPR